MYFNLHFASPYGVDEPAAGLISIYSYGKHVYVKVPQVSGEVHIYNVMGQPVVSEKIGSEMNSYRVEHAGYYVVQLIDGEHITTSKVYIK